MAESHDPLPSTAFSGSWIARSGLRLVTGDGSSKHGSSGVAQALPAGGHWLEVTKHALQRALLVTAGVILLAIGVGVSVSVILLPQGLALACIGIGVIIWGSVGEITAGTP